MAPRKKTTKPVVEQPIEEVPAEVLESFEEPEYAIGKVINCTSLRIRKNPSTEAEILTTIDAGKNLEFKNSDVAGWYAVKLDKISGFVMADFIG